MKVPVTLIVKLFREKTFAYIDWNLSIYNIFHERFGYVVLFYTTDYRVDNLYSFVFLPGKYGII